MRLGARIQKVIPNKALGALFAGLLGCGAPQLVFVPSPPVVENARSLVLLLPGPSPRIWAAALQDGRPTAPIEIPTVVAPGPLQIRAFYYVQTLESLELPRGEVHGTSKRTCDLAHPVRVMSVEESASDWIEQSLDLVEASRELLLPSGCEVPDRCRRFQVTEFELPTRDDVLILHPTEPGRALLGAKGGRFSWLTKDGVTDAPRLRGAPSRAMYPAADGALWLGGTRGRVERWSLQERLSVELVATSTTESILGIGGIGEERLVISALDEENIRIYYREKDSWQIVHEQSVVDHSPSQTVVHFLEPKKALITYGGAVLLLFEDGVMEPVVVESRIPLIELKINGVASIEGRGTFLCANDGALYEATNARYRAWGTVRGTALGDGIESLISVEDGLVFGGANGLLNQFYPGARLCFSESLVRSDVEVIAEVEDGLVVSGGNPDRGRPNTVAWLTEFN